MYDEQVSDDEMDTPPSRVRFNNGSGSSTHAEVFEENIEEYVIGF